MGMAGSVPEGVEKLQGTYVWGSRTMQMDEERTPKPRLLHEPLILPAAVS